MFFYHGDTLGMNRTQLCFLEEVKEVASVASCRDRTADA